jgi:hypothetical protein
MQSVLPTKVSPMTKEKSQAGWVSIPAAAAMLSCSTSRARNLLAEGGVPVLRCGRCQPRVKVTDLAKFVTAHSSPIPAA